MSWGMMACKAKETAVPVARGTLGGSPAVPSRRPVVMRPRPAASAVRPRFVSERRYAIRRGDTISGILLRQLKIGPSALRRDIHDELADFVDLRSIRVGHKLRALYLPGSGRLKRLYYYRDPIYIWWIDVCWKGQGCEDGDGGTPGRQDSRDKAAAHEWSLRTHKQSEDAFLVRRGLRLRIGRRTRTLGRALLRAGERPRLLQKIRKMFGGGVSFARMRRGATLDLLFEKIQAKGRIYAYRSLLYASYRPSPSRAETVLYVRPSGRSREAEGVYRSDGSKFERRQVFALPARPFRVGSRYGRRFHPIRRRWRMHWGVDVRSPCRRRVYAVASGRVITRGWRGGAGRMISIRHHSGLVSRYMHLSRYAVRRRSRVRRGQVIGYIGTTGMSTGCHLHFEMLRNGRHFNPLRIIRMRKRQTLSCRSMLSLWRQQRAYCAEAKIAPKDCGFVLPRRCYRRMRRPFWRILRQWCTLFHRGRCPHRRPQRPGAWPARRR